MPGPLTRQAVEVVAVARCKAAMTQAKMAFSVPPAAPTADLNDPIATALEELGTPPADRTLVVDADLAPATAALQARFLDLVELRVLKTAVQALVLAPQAVQWEDYRRDRGANHVADLTAYVTAKETAYLAKWAQSGSAAVGPMERQIHPGPQGPAVVFDGPVPPWFRF